jgi:group II intron reverse transcriptase/maturase
MPTAHHAEDKTRQLQTKLYQAAKRSPTRRFHALYDRLHRTDVLERAYRDVKENHGAPAVDGVTIEDIEAQGAEAFLEELGNELRTHTYRPLPVRRVSIPKRDGGQRHLGIPPIRDRVVQAAFKIVTEPIFEADFLDCSWGFRPGRCQHDALDAVREEVLRGRVHVVDADIASFFDTIPRKVLVAALRRRISDRRMIKLVQGWLKAGVMAGETLLHPEAGTPQGSVVSPLLANAVLHYLDTAWQPHRIRLGMLVRWADDLVILCPSRERAEAALVALRQVLASLGLALSEGKTRLVDLRDDRQGFVFLGFEHRRTTSRKGKPWCYRWPSKPSVERAKEEIRARTNKRNFRKPVGAVVEDVNCYLRGWRNYYRFGNAANVFHNLDRFVDERLARFISGKYSHSGRGFGYLVLIEHRRLGLVQLSGSVRNGSVHAVR